MSWLSEYDESFGVVFQEPFDPDAFISNVIGGGATTQWSGASESMLNLAFKEGRISEEEYRAELKARNKGAKAIEEFVRANQPEQAGPPAPGTEEGNEAIVSGFKGLSLEDILTNHGADQAYQFLIASGQSPQTAIINLRAAAEKVIKAREAEAKKLADEQAEAHRQQRVSGLSRSGIGPGMSEAEILNGAKQGLWSGDDAFEALQAIGKLAPEAAASKMRLAGFRLPQDTQGGFTNAPGAPQMGGGVQQGAVFGGPMLNAPPRTMYDSMVQTAAQGMMQPQAPMQAITAPSQAIYDQVRRAYETGGDPGAVYRGLTGVV